MTSTAALLRGRVLLKGGHMKRPVDLSMTAHRLNSRCGPDFSSPHERFDLVFNRVGPDLVPLRGRMKAIGHDFGRECSISGQELVADVRVKHLLVVRELREFAIDFLDGGAERIRGVCISGKDAEKQHLCLWLTFLEFFNDKAIPINDLV